MSDDRPTLEELKTLWRKRLQEAEQELELARGAARKLEEELRSESMPSPEIHYAYQKALRAETLALEKYANVLTIVHDLVVHGAIPRQGPEST
jgi:hypothetical protein